MKYFTVLVCFVGLLLGYERPPYVEPAIWDFVLPYLIPEDHEIKPQLDELFSKKRYTASSRSIEKSSFNILHQNPRSGLYVMKHSKLKGFVIKVLPDNRELECEWCQFVMRIKGALAIKKVIEENQWQDRFLVPQKWIYLLPPETYQEKGKAFILIAEDMHPLSNSNCKKIWRSNKIKPEFLNAFFNVVMQAGLIDSLWLRNVPFNTEGKVIFLDTEHYDESPVPYYKLLPYLSTEMAAYWRYLTGAR